jgi:hypothetical protein
VPVRELSTATQEDVLRIVGVSQTLVQFTESQLATWKAVNPGGTEQDLEDDLSGIVALVDGARIYIHVYLLVDPEHDDLPWLAVLAVPDGTVVPPDWWDNG